MELSQKYEVLIVDDIPKNIQVISSILSHHNIEVSFATNGFQALKNIEFKAPDLILLDISMPEMDGYEVCSKVRKMENAKDVPIIFLTARTETEDIVKGFDYGAVDYVTKPYNSKELISRVFTHLELKHSRDMVLSQANVIKAQNDELRALNATKDKFFSIISHDLKNPFHVIMGYSKLLIREVQKYNDTVVSKYANTIVEAAGSGSKLLENLLHWSRAQRGILECVPKMVAFRRVVEAAVDYQQADITTKHIELILNVEEDIYIWADERMMNTVMRNLLSNAVKFTDFGGSISITTNKHILNDKQDKSFVLVSVKDNGIGIPAEDMNKLFRIDTTYTRVGTNNEKGTGLGLILCKEFIEKNNGKIWIESEPKMGSTFYFSVPLYNKQNVKQKL